MQIRSTPPNPTKTKEEDVRLPESHRSRRWGATSEQIWYGRNGEEAAGEEEQPRPTPHHSTAAGLLTGVGGEANEKKGEQRRAARRISLEAGARVEVSPFSREPPTAAPESPEIAREDQRTAEP
jgi:hypothetical protein